ncbi:MAG: protein-disulfide reductase DsbD, partial [Methylophilaceae bacterium]|nr:protein-disulfide reductase DsbD [Methylophilaceae bacterium]
MQLSPLTSSAANSSGLSLFDESDKSDFLPPDQAFKLDMLVQDNYTLIGKFTVVPGYYLYKERIQFEIKDASLGTISQIDMPAGDVKNDPNFGKQEVYHHDFTSRITIENAAQAMVIQARYQGCSEQGLCYAPQVKTYHINMAEVAPLQPMAKTPTEANGEDKATNLLKSGQLWLIAVGFFGFGLLLSFTPCVLPMIPILSGIIVGDEKVHQAETSRLHSFNLSLAYVLGIALSYTIAGIAAGLSGQLLSNALQSPLMLTATAVIFVVLSFSMFGFYELRLPSFIQDYMVNTSNKLKSGQLLGVFLMGVISAMIVSPCVAAPLAGALIYISQTRDVLLGGVALFALSIGMGVPLLLIGASAGHMLPRAGGWMTAVRNFFGILMLAVAVYIISPIIDIHVQMLLWS